MFSCKNFIVFVELFLYMLGSFVMMIDVLVVCSLHSMVSFCRFGFFGVVVRSCGSTVVLCSVWLCGWTSGSYNTWLLVFCMFHTVAFFQKGLFLLRCTLLLVVCRKWYRWLGVDVDLQMRKIFKLLYCLLILRCNLLLPLLIYLGSHFLWLFYFCLVWRVVWCKSFLDIVFPVLFSRFSISSSECKCMAMPPLGSV